jgi:FixJ family two-component response regulator
MISSKDYAQDRSIATELGAIEFITKPMPMQTISDVVLKYTEASNKT